MHVIRDRSRSRVRKSKIELPRSERQRSKVEGPKFQGQRSDAEGPTTKVKGPDLSEEIYLEHDMKQGTSLLAATGKKRYLLIPSTDTVLGVI